MLVLLLRPAAEGPATDADDARPAPAAAPAAASATAALEAAPAGVRARPGPSLGPALPAPQEPTRRLEVTVRTARGTPVEGATAFLEDTDAGARGAVTDAGGRASLPAPAADGWVLVRTREGVWGRRSYGTEDAQVTVEVPVTPVLSGRVVDPWGRPAAGVRLSLAGVGRENPARAWPGVRRWEMRSEVGEVVTDAAGRFEVAGLADLAGGFEVSSPDGEVRGPYYAEPWMDGSNPGRLIVGRFTESVLVVRDAVSDAPVFRASVDAVPGVAAPGFQVAEETAEGSFRIRWAVPPERSADPARVQVSAPGFLTAEVVLPPAEPRYLGAPDAPATAVRMERHGGARAGVIRLRMPPGTRSLVPRVYASVSVIENGRGFATTGTLVNQGAWWEHRGGPGRWRLPGILGLSAPASVDLREGEIVETDLTGPAWGAVVLRLRAEADLARGAFDVVASPADRKDGLRFRVVADEAGRADAGGWPPGAYVFRVSRSAEEGASERVEVRAGGEPAIVEVPLRNRLTR